MTLEQQEFYYLCLKLIEIRGEEVDSTAGFVWSHAAVDDMSVTKTGRRLVVDHIVDRNGGEIERVYSPEHGFNGDIWKRYLEPLRRELILEELADV
jgi:hypothetical protein